ncbi:hypothetical protein JCM10207_001957 [Rhodosporidiobolus poonsookiae]
MPPRKKAVAVPSKPLPPPNTAHPCASLLPTVLSTSSLPDRPHSASYHTFLSSPFYPSTSRTPSGSEPPTKKRKKADEPTLPPLLDEAIDAGVVQRKLLSWFDGVKETRGMPWRKEVYPAALSKEERAQRGYEVWVSEIMLQQTQVATVVPYWTKWMAKFPTVRDLAKADVEEVNQVWQGLGYYSRAKRLLDGAKTVVKDYKGRLPETVEELLEVDGIGPYTAGAISSIAFAKRSPLVDGNVQRVLSRLTTLHAPATAKPTTNFIWALADALVPAQSSSPPSETAAADRTSSPHFKRSKRTGNELDDVGGLNRPGAWNQALMELGATVCTPKNPKCDECPVAEECLAYAEARYVAHRPSVSPDTEPDAEPVDIEDLCTLCTPLPYEDAAEAAKHSVEVYPMAKERAKKREEETAVCVVEWVRSGREGDEEERKVLLFKRPEKGLLAGLFEFPSVDLPPSTPSTAKPRSKHLTSLLRLLLDDDDLSSALTSSSSSPSDPASNGALRILERTALPPVEHVYSHMKRTYFAERLVLSSSSSSPPALHTAASAPKLKKHDDAEPLVQSLAGRGKWVDAADVRTSNIGGAVGKVWDERDRVVKGLPAGKGKKSVAGGAGKGKAKAKEQEKGQGSVLAFFGKKALAAGKVEKEKKEKAKQEDSDDDLVIVEERAVAVEKVKVDKENRAAETSVVVEAEEKKVYKKRRIAPASDEEDEG